MDMHDFINVVKERIVEHSFSSLVIVNKYPWILPTIIGRLREELGIELFVVLTSDHVAGQVAESLQHVRNDEVEIISDLNHGISLIKDNLFDTVLSLNRLAKEISSINNGKKIIVDLTGSDGSVAVTAMYSIRNILGEKAFFTIVKTIPLYGIPAYPGSPRWLHKVYMYGSKQEFTPLKTSIVNDYPRTIEWRGSRGVFIALSKVFNALTQCGCIETYYDDRRNLPETGGKLEAWIHTIGALREKRRLFIINELSGPDRNTSNMIYHAWKNIAELLEMTLGDVDRQVIDRLVMQVQRYVGAADLIIKEASSQQWFDEEGEKLHRVINKFANEKTRLAIVPDTNLFYQGIHMALLKASIRQGLPWSPLRNVSIYVPRCAEAEINGKVAETNPDAGGLQRISYIMALLANRALLETKYYYDAKTLNATAQPCEASMAVEAPNLSENRIILITADHKAYAAWQTLNVCRGKVACAYIGHSDKPLDTDTIYGKFYVSIASSLLAYISSLFLPVTIKGSRGEVRLIIKNLKGSNAPVINVHRVKEQ